MSQILKVVETRNEVQALLYTNIRIREHDNLEIRRQKNMLKRSVSRYLKSKRRCIEALLQNNFTQEDYYCTLTFRDEKLPDKPTYADTRFTYFIKALRKAGCGGVRYLKVLEHKHGVGRYHFHAGRVSGQGSAGHSRRTGVQPQPSAEWPGGPYHHAGIRVGRLPDGGALRLRADRTGSAVRECLRVCGVPVLAHSGGAGAEN